MIAKTDKFVVKIGYIIGAWKGEDHYTRDKVWELHIAYSDDRTMRVEFDNEEERDEAFNLLVDALTAE